MNDSELRDLFDKQLEVVLPQLPPAVKDFLGKLPLVVEDYPSDRVVQEMGLPSRTHLCGLYTGIPLTERHVEQSGVLSDTIYLFREGLMALSRRGNQIDIAELRRQIRITILHEIGHHVGLDEDELRDLGY